MKEWGYKKLYSSMSQWIFTNKSLCLNEVYKPREILKIIAEFSETREINWRHDKRRQNDLKLMGSKLKGDPESMRNDTRSLGSLANNNWALGDNF